MITTRLTPAILTAALCLPAAPALADLTVDQAWGVWKAQAQALGLSLTALETRDGEALEVGKVTLAAALPMEAGSFTIHFPGPRFEPADDGSVTVILPERAEMRGNLRLADKEPLSARLSFETTGGSAVMRGSPDDVETLWQGDRAEMRLVNLDPPVFAEAGLNLRLSLDSYSFSNRTRRQGDLLIMDQIGDYAGYDYEFGGPEADGPLELTMSETGRGEDVQFTNQLSLPANGFDPLALHDALRQGLAMKIDSQVALVQSHEETMLNGEPFSYESDLTRDYVAVLSVDQTGLQLTGSTGHFEAGFKDPAIPVVVNFSGSAVTGAMHVPLLKADSAQTAMLALDISDMVFDDALWALFDADGQLPRDPMQLALDLSGEVAVKEEPLDIPALIERDGLAGVIDPVTAALNHFSLSAMGTVVEAQGAFTFDAADTETYPDMPRPDGTLTATLTGANTLIDQLIALGLIGEDEAMGARMMIGMITRPAEGEDVLHSEITMTPEGHVLANGLRLK